MWLHFVNFTRNLSLDSILVKLDLWCFERTSALFVRQVQLREWVCVPFWVARYSRVHIPHPGTRKAFLLAFLIPIGHFLASRREVKLPSNDSNISFSYMQSKPRMLVDLKSIIAKDTKHPTNEIVRAAHFGEYVTYQQKMFSSTILATKFSSCFRW